MTIVQGVLKVPATTEGKKPGGKRVEVTPGKSHHGLYIAIMVVLMAVIVIGVVVFMAQTPAKTSQDAQTEVKNPEVLQVLPAENPVVNTVIAGVMIAQSDSIVTVGNGESVVVRLDSIPKEINFGDLRITGISIDKNWVITGYMENRGKRAIDFADNSFFLKKTTVDIGIAGAGIYFIDGKTHGVESDLFQPGQKKSFVTNSMLDLIEDKKLFAQEVAKAQFIKINFRYNMDK